MDRALASLGDRLALDLYAGPPRQVKVFSDGAPNAEETWVGICTLCEARHVTNLDPKRYLTMPIPCGEAMGNLRSEAQCTGNVLLSADNDALLAAFKIGGWDALRDDAGCGTVVKYDAAEITISRQNKLPGGGQVRETQRRRR